MNQNKWILMGIFLIFVPIIQAATIHGTLYDLNLDPVKDALVIINTVPQQQYLSKDGTYSFEVSKGTYTLVAKNQNLLSKDQVKIDKEGKFVYDVFMLDSFSEEDQIFADAGSLNVSEEKKGFAKYPLWTWLLAIGMILILIGRAVLIKKKFERKNGSQEIKVTMKKEAEKKSDVYEKKEVEEKKVGEVRGKVGTEERKEGQVEEKLENNEDNIDENKVGETLGDDNFEEEDEEPDYLNNTLDIIKKNEGRITQKKLRKEMMHLSEGKVSLILTELEHKGLIEKVKRGRGNVILLK